MAQPPTTVRRTRLKASTPAAPSEADGRQHISTTLKEGDLLSFGNGEEKLRVQKISTAEITFEKLPK